MAESDHRSKATNADETKKTGEELNGNGAATSENLRDLPELKSRMRKRSKIPIVQVVVSTRHDEALDVVCGSCGGPTDKIYLPQEYWGKRIRVRAEEVASYRCRI